MSRQKYKYQVFVRDKWQITLPKSIRAILDVRIGEGFKLFITREGILLVPLKLWEYPEKTSEKVKENRKNGEKEI